MQKKCRKWGRHIINSEYSLGTYSFRQKIGFKKNKFRIAISKWVKCCLGEVGDEVWVKWEWKEVGSLWPCMLKGRMFGKHSFCSLSIAWCCSFCAVWGGGLTGCLWVGQNSHNVENVPDNICRLFCLKFLRNTCLKLGMNYVIRQVDWTRSTSVHDTM